ncbi:MAG TPA: ABC transporter permease [Gemmatimonadota bacterium]|nr:ABC transporter permease [Gemmatimonadota bacterium]
MLGAVLRDIRYAIRTLGREPGWTLAAVGTLALAAGATTAVFSVVNAVVFRPLDYPDPDRLVALEFQPADEASRAAWATQSERMQNHLRISTNYPDYQRWQGATEDVLEGLAAYDDNWEYSVRLQGGAERLSGALVSANLFQLLQVQPHIGRSFEAADDLPEAAGTVILSYQLWQSRLGGNANAIGTTITVNERPHTLIGVMPRGFRFPNSDIQIWMPMAHASRGAGSFNYELLGRLAPNLTFDQAATRLSGRSLLLHGRGDAEQSMRAAVSSLHVRLVGDVRAQLFVFLAAVVAVLLIACVNVVNLMLARATHREYEHVVRGALGARPLRLAQQLLTESLILGALGAGLGLVLALVLSDALVALSPVSIPRIEETGIDGRVLSFALALAIAVGVVVGLVPAWRASRTDLARGLNAGSRGSSELGHHGQIREMLVVAQIALALVLLVCGALLLRSFASLLDARSGFDPRGVLTFETQLPRSRYPGFEEKKRFYDEMMEDISTMPGVRAAGLANYLPATQWFNFGSFQVEGYEPAPQEKLETEVMSVSAGYFKAFSTPLIDGRLFDPHDGASQSVVLINEWMARRYFGTGSAVGRRVQLDDEWATVVGVVADIRHRNVLRAGPQVYVPYANGSNNGSMDVVVRTDGDPAALATTVRRQIALMDPEVVVYGVMSLEDRLAGSVSEPRFRSVLLGAFALASLLLSTIGVYGVMAYSVARRTRELAIRKALGARQLQVVRHVVLRGLLVIGIGLGLGLIGAYAAAGALQAYVFNLKPRDPATFALASVVLLVAGSLACWIPALRATRVDPLAALRLE